LAFADTLRISHRHLCQSDLRQAEPVVAATDARWGGQSQSVASRQSAWRPASAATAGQTALATLALTRVGAALMSHGRLLL